MISNHGTVRSYSKRKDLIYSFPVQRLGKTQAFLKVWGKEVHFGLETNSTLQRNRTNRTHGAPAGDTGASATRVINFTAPSAYFSQYIER